MEGTALKKYAQLIVRTGINIQPNQTLVVSCPVECAYFARMISQTAYEAGAREVVMNWTDEISTKIRYLHAPDEIFDEFPEWRKEFYISLARKGAAFLTIDASDPELMKEVEPGRISRASKASRTALKEYSERLMSNQNTWCVASIPTAAWAKKVFPGETEEQAVEKLWKAIFKSVRADAEDPVKAWDLHKAAMKKNMDSLNQLQLKWIHMKNSIGTDLRVELPEKHIWLGGSDISADGVEFIANMPTEEIFTAPARKGVNGTVVASMPLNYNGNLIEDFSITFQDGQITGFRAEKGYEILKQVIETDEGSRYLGELALVPYRSPISDMKILFYNTLFDENASCHLAIGKAYPVCLRGSESMSKEELIRAGINDSLVHLDFMFGTADLEIEGMTSDGRTVPIFRNGNFVLGE
jgi:aminopeptidase